MPLVAPCTSRPPPDHLPPDILLQLCLSQHFTKTHQAHRFPRSQFSPSSFSPALDQNSTHSPSITSPPQTTRFIIFSSHHARQDPPHRPRGCSATRSRTSPQLRHRRYLLPDRSYRQLHSSCTRDPRCLCHAGRQLHPRRAASLLRSERSFAIQVRSIPRTKICTRRPPHWHSHVHRDLTATTRGLQCIYRFDFVVRRTGKGTGVVSENTCETNMQALLQGSQCGGATWEWVTGENQYGGRFTAGDWNCLSVYPPSQPLACAPTFRGPQQPQSAPSRF